MRLPIMNGREQLDQVSMPRDWFNRRLAWKEALRAATRETISRYKRDGTVGMSADCLWQCTRIPQQNGPQGTNAAWVARQTFNEILAEPEFKSFIC